MSMTTILTMGRKAYSVLLYMEGFVVPLLGVSGQTWDLTPKGVHAVQSFYLSEPKVTLYFKARYCKYLACEAQLAGNTLLAAQYSHKESDLYGECASFMNAANASLSSFISHCYVIPRLLLSSSFCSPSACCPATRRWCRPFSSRNPCRRRNCNCSLL